jgi:5-methylcytosine-specific restriction endonuclease McrA
LWECTRCHRMKPRGNFGRVGRGEDCRHSHCRECRREPKAANAARRRGAGVTKIPHGWVRQLWASQAGRCALCWRPIFGAYHIDHKVAVSRGGAHTFSNLQLTHPACNLRKGSKL